MLTRIEVSDMSSENMLSTVEDVPTIIEALGVFYRENKEGHDAED